MKRFWLVLEPLESRIAPAVFFVDGQNLTITNSSGIAQTSYASAATAAGATVAILLHHGDSLVFDSDGDHTIDSAADVTFVKVTAGEAMAFFTDTSSSGKFTVSDFTGLAVGNGVKATINGTLHGSIDTLLAGSGSFTPNLRQHSSVAGLSIDGTVDGNLQAGGNISDVIFTVPKTGAASLDLTGSLLTGSAAASISFNGGGLTLSPSFTPVAGQNGGNISGVVLPRGLEGDIETGDGGASASAKGGAGGSISKLTLTGAIAGNVFAGNGGILAGNGGNGGGAHGAGGAGGSISAVYLTITNDFATNTYVEGGVGGNANGTNSGAGGEISSTVVKSAANLGAGLYVFGGNAGNGGNDAYDGLGGAGGAISKTTITALDSIDGGIQILGGYGSYSTGKEANGGAGGMVSSSSITVASATGAISIYGGEGGPGDNGGVGGASGSVTFAKITVTTEAALGAVIAGEPGGGAGIGACTGGHGGNVSNSTLILQGTSGGNIGIFGGSGGEPFVSLEHDGKGGTGGSVSNVTISASGDLEGNSIEVSSGSGGNAGPTGATASGGKSGNVSGVKVTAGASDANTIISSGDGGDAVGAYSGGNSGSVSNVTITNLSALAGNSMVFTGRGGDPGSSGNGGNSGGIRDVVVKDSTIGAPTYEWQIFTGAGGTAVGGGKHGGNTGNLSDVTFTGADSSVVFGEGNAAGSGTDGAFGGRGGSIEKIKGGALFMSVLASPGGDSDSGDAGAGGSIGGVTFSVGDFARLIAAGNGGSVTTAGAAGLGGSVAAVKITGDIGDFQSDFDVNGADSGMGGLVAGLGGEGADGTYSIARNGSIVGVSATRIAAIIAGEFAGTSLDAYNAVFKITGLKTSSLGADVNGNGEFDWKSGSTPETGPGFTLPASGTNNDTPLDGLVIVAAGGFAQSAAVPLASPGIIFTEPA